MFFLTHSWDTRQQSRLVEKMKLKTEDLMVEQEEDEGKGCEDLMVKKMKLKTEDLMVEQEVDEGKGCEHLMVEKDGTED
jgi:hypothetical protein